MSTSRAKGSENLCVWAELTRPDRSEKTLRRFDGKLESIQGFDLQGE